MSRTPLSHSITGIAVFAGMLLLAACPPAGNEGGQADTTDAGQTRRNQGVGEQARVLAGPMLDQRRNCLSRSYSNGHTVKLRMGQDITIRAHDSTIAYDLATLEQGEHFLAIMIDNGTGGFADYAVAPGDTTCWAVQADSVGLRSVFYGRDQTVMLPLTIEMHSDNHGKADADWIEERRYPAEFRRIGNLTETSARPAKGWLPEFLRPGVAYAATVAARDTTDSGGSGPWTTCISNGCCKPR